MPFARVPLPASRCPRFGLPDKLSLCHIEAVRLSAEQATAIRQSVLRFDPEAQVLLFGSRADDRRRGGDIDLLIVSKRIGLGERLQLQSALEDVLGLQKIDLLIVPDVESNPFAKFVHARSVPL